MPEMAQMKMWGSERQWRSAQNIPSKAVEYPMHRRKPLSIRSCWSAWMRHPGIGLIQVSRW